MIVVIRFDFIILCDESHRMLYDDFCKCTFGEFESICEAWREMTEGQNRDAWERARTIAAIIIQPHLKKRN